MSTNEYQELEMLRTIITALKAYLTKKKSWDNTLRELKELKALLTAYDTVTNNE